MFGVVLGLLVGFAIGLVVGRRQGVRAAPPPVTASVVGATPITKKARKVGLTEEAFQPADDILEKMQEAWEKGEEFEPPPPPPRTLPILAPSPVIEPSPELEEKANRVLARLEGGGGGEEQGEMPPSPAPEAAPGGDTVSEAINELTAMGYGDELRFEDGALCCRQCQQCHDTKEAEVEHVRRFEGQSDPADEAIVLALRCPRCGAGGVLVSSYGPDADPALAEAFTYLASKARHG